MSLTTYPKRKGQRLASALCAGGSLLLLAGIMAWAFPAQRGPGPIVYRPAGMNDVAVRRDLVYKQRESGSEDLRFDVFLPNAAAPAEGWPCVVLIHGGPVSSTTKPKDWKAFDSFGRVLAASDLGAVTFNYRFFSKATMALAAADVSQLILFVRENAATLHINPQRLCLWAFSGGGCQLSFALRNNADYVRCLVAFYPQLDADPGHEAYSLVAQLRSRPLKMAPLLVARAGKDAGNIDVSIDAVEHEAKALGLPVEIVHYPDGVHAFDIAQDTDESRRIIQHALAFVKTHLAPTAVPLN